MSDDEKESPTADEKKFIEVVEKDPSAKRISDLATTPPPKDISSIKAAADLLDAEDERNDDAPQARREDEA